MSKITAKATKKSSARETDNFYFKILVYFVVGTIWIKINGAPALLSDLFSVYCWPSTIASPSIARLEYAILPHLGSASYSAVGGPFPLGLALNQKSRPDQVMAERLFMQLNS